VTLKFAVTQAQRSNQADEPNKFSS